MIKMKKTPAADGNSGGPEQVHVDIGNLHATPGTAAGQRSPAIVPFGKHRGKDVLEVRRRPPHAPLFLGEARGRSPTRGVLLSFFFIWHLRRRIG
jgi:hypothetical protein